jgi:replication initiation and membrane attachment protein DnaB
MPDETQDRRGKVHLNSFLADFRSTLTDHELRKKYELTALGFVNLIKALLARNLITSDDLAKRREMAVQRDLAKESKFLSGLSICRHCSHPSPHPFENCPACGAPTDEPLSQSQSTNDVSVSGNHIFIEASAEGGEVEVIEEIAETSSREASRSRRKKESPREKSTPKGEEAEEELGKDEGDSQPRSSALGEIRSLFSKLKKK